MTFNKTHFAVGDLVQLREGSAIAASRRNKLHVCGVVVASKNIAGYGEGIMVQWPGEEPPWSFQHAGLFKLAENGLS